MATTVGVTIPVDPDTAVVLQSPGRKEAVGRYVSRLLAGGRLPDVLAEAVADLKREAHANGLTDETVEAEMTEWRAGR